MNINRLKFDDFLIAYEKNNPVESWQFNGIDLWPIVKIMSSLRVRDLGQEIVKDRIRSKNNKLKNAVNPLLRIKNLFFQLKDILAGFVYLITNWQKSSTSFILFGSKGFRIDINGFTVNPFFQSITDYAKQNKEINPYVFSFDDIAAEKRRVVNTDENIIYAKYFIPILRILQTITKDYKEDHRFLHFVKEIQCKFPEFKDARSYLLGVINRVHVNSKVYTLLFRMYKPKYAICLTFYSNNMFAMLFAAHKAGIKTIDLAHGYIANKSSIVYSRHQKCPPVGYNTLPDYFWVWDYYIKEMLEKETSIRPQHKILVGGNPKIYYLQNKMQPPISNKKKIILLTLTSNLPETRIIETMKFLNADYEWWIRMHPSRVKQAPILVDFFKDNGICEGFNVEDANSKTLYEILQLCTAHVSYHSTSIYESILWGNKPIMLSQNSEMVYQPYVNEGKAIGAFNYTPKMLKEAILSTIDYKNHQTFTEPLFRQYVDMMAENSL